MTDGKISVRELLEKGSDATFLRKMIGFGRERPQGHLSRGQRPVGFPQFGHRETGKLVPGKVWVLPIAPGREVQFRRNSLYSDDDTAP
jgi:hypothetical protein